MNYVVLVIVCTAIVFLNGGALASLTTTGNETDEATRTCTMSAEDEKDRHWQLVDTAWRCLTSYEGIDGVRNFTTLIQFRQFFNHFCNDVPKFKQCLDGVSDTAEICQNQTYQLQLQIWTGILETVLNTGCANSGESFSNFYDAFKGHDGGADKAVILCREFVVKKESHTTVEPSKKFLEFHRYLIEIKSCLLEKVENNEDHKTVVKTFLDDLRNNLKCLHPEENILALCSTFQEHET